MLQKFYYIKIRAKELIKIHLTSYYIVITQSNPHSLAYKLTFSIPRLSLIAWSMTETKNLIESFGKTENPNFPKGFIRNGMKTTNTTMKHYISVSTIEEKNY